MIDNEITHETLDNIIIEAISTIRRKKRPNVNSIFEHLSKELHNSNITSTPTDTRLSNLTIDGKLAIKYSLGKASTGLKTITCWNLLNLKGQHHHYHCLLHLITKLH